MFQEGQLLRFSPFKFKNGANPKKKYFIVLKHIDDNLMLASLPTSKDHIPSDVLSQSTGCINIPERAVNAYVFMPDTLVTNIFSFPLPTFVYEEQVDEYAAKYLNEMESEIENLGIIFNELFYQIKDCLKKSNLIKRKYRNYL